MLLEKILMIKKKIINKILKQKQGLRLDDFIDICLFDPKGYYENIKNIGKKSDFTTSPEISQLFGEILGLYIYCLWKKKYKKNLNLIELGPGNGTLMNDIIRITKKLDKFHEIINVILIEKNLKLIFNQKKNLTCDIINLSWMKDFKINNNMPSIIIANEFFDCFPVRQFLKKNNRWYEKFVNYNQKEDIFFYDNNEILDSLLLKRLLEYEYKEIAEISEKREEYFEKICKHIFSFSGMIILIDYGYTEYPNNFTLQTLYNHKHSNLLENFGTQDITSYVDFRSLIKIAKKYKLNKIELISQREFLIKNGIIERMNKILDKCNFEQKKMIKSGCDRIIKENDMGSTFKFLIISK